MAPTCAREHTSAAQLHTLSGRAREEGAAAEHAGLQQAAGRAQEELHVVPARKLRQPRVQLGGHDHRARQVRVHLRGAPAQGFIQALDANCGSCVSSLVDTTTVRDRCGSTCMAHWRMSLHLRSCSVPAQTSAWNERKGFGFRAVRLHVEAARGRVAPVAGVLQAQDDEGLGSRVTRLHDEAARGRVAPVVGVLQAQDDVLALLHLAAHHALHLLLAVLQRAVAPPRRRRDQAWRSRCQSG